MIIHLTRKKIAKTYAMTYQIKEKEKANHILAQFTIKLCYYKFKHAKSINNHHKSNQTPTPRSQNIAQSLFVPPPSFRIIECDSRQYTSSISKYSQNPQWMHQLTIEASKPTCLIQIYVNIKCCRFTIIIPMELMNC